MFRSRLVVALCTLAAACGSPAGPKGSYAGEWVGATAQGEPIVFSISSDEAVTSITVGHSFNGCRGSQTFANLNLSIAPKVVCVPGPCSDSITSFRAFGYQSGSSLLGEQTTEVNGGFPPGGGAQGSVNFRNFAGCGNAIGIAWSATKK